jgi:hypothetical protein
MGPSLSRWQLCSGQKGGQGVGLTRKGKGTKWWRMVMVSPWRSYWTARRRRKSSWPRRPWVWSGFPRMDLGAPRPGLKSWWQTEATTAKPSAPTSGDGASILASQSEGEGSPGLVGSPTPPAIGCAGSWREPWPGWAITGDWWSGMNGISRSTKDFSTWPVSSFCSINFCNSL